MSVTHFLPCSSNYISHSNPSFFLTSFLSTPFPQYFSFLTTHFNSTSKTHSQNLSFTTHHNFHSSSCVAVPSSLTSYPAVAVLSPPPNSGQTPSERTMISASVTPKSLTNNLPLSKRLNLPKVGVLPSSITFFFYSFSFYHVKVFF